MPRSLPIGLTEVLKSSYATTHSTLELSLPSDIAPAITHYFATARLTIDGVVYDRQLRDTGAVKTSLTRAADRVTVELQNVDTILGVDLLRVADTLYGANVRFGRYWKDLRSAATFHHILLTGAVAGVEINETVVRLTLISDTYAAVSVGAKEQVIRTCRFQVQGEFRGTNCGYSGPKLTCNGLIDDADGCEGRHGTPLKRAKFGGFVYIEGANTIAGAAALPVPAYNQLMRLAASDGTVSATSKQQPFLALHEDTFNVANDNTNLQTRIAPKGTPTKLYNAVFDYNAVADGVTNTTTQVQAAIDAAELAGGGTVFLQAGTYKVTGLTINGHVKLVGSSDGEVVIYSTSNAPIIDCGQTSFLFPVLENIKIRGSVSAGSSQIGLRVDDATYGLRATVRNVWIENCGGAGLYVGNAFSSFFENIFSTNCAGGNYVVNSANMPVLTFRHCDSGTIHSSYRTGYHIKAGYVVMRDCNSIYGGSNPEWCVTIGRRIGLYGETAANGSAFVRFENCNFESSTSGGVQCLFNSRASFHACTWVGDGAASGSYKAVLYDACQINPTETTGSINSGSPTLTVASAVTWTIGQGIKVAGAGIAGADLTTTVSNISGTTFTLAANASTTVSGAVVSHTDEVFYPLSQSLLGVIDDDCVFSNSPASYYANSEPVHVTAYPITAGVIPPTATNGRGPKIAGDKFVSNFRNDTSSATWPLPRMDGFLPVQTITASTTFVAPGVRYIECNHSTPITITLYWPGWALNSSNEIIIIKDVSTAGAATNNITIQASSGGTVNGSTYVINTDKGSVILVPHSADDYRVVATYSPGGGSGSGTVNSGAANQLAYYASTGTTVSGLTSANSSVLATNGSGVPSWVTTLPSGLSVASISVTKLANLTSNGFVKTSSSDGTLSVDTATYLTGNQTITLSSEVTGSGSTSISTTINRAIVPTWTALHTFNPGTTPTDALFLDIAALGSNGTRDSHNIVLRGRARNGSDNPVDWKIFNDVTTNTGFSQLTFSNRTNSGVYTDLFTFADDGTISATAFVGDGSGLSSLDATQLVNTVALANGGTGANLSSPGADRLLFWDDSAGQTTWLTLGTNLSITGTTINAAGSSAANPTGTIGLTAVNGSASTFMRSDAAPALSQSIAPTWTASHTFAATMTAREIDPQADNTYDLGTTSLRWKTVHVGPGSVVVHNDATDTLKATLGFSGTTAQLTTDAATPLQLRTGSNAGIFLNTNGTIGFNLATATSGNFDFRQLANGNTVLYLRRATDTSPTGNFERFDNAAGTALWTVDITGTLTAGTIPAARVSSGTVAVANGGTGLASGTSGGIPYFSGSTTIASSAALAASAIVIGGGAGAAPSTTTTGTGVLTALAVNVGSSGAFVVNGGALGTPSSGALTNCTGLPPTTGISGWPANASGVLTNNGAGVLSWAAAGGSPGGSSTHVQYNNSGVFGGVAGFTFNGTSTITLGVAGTSVGAVGFRNATSGAITLQPVTGALGTRTLSLPATTGTLSTLTGAEIEGFTVGWVSTTQFTVNSGSAYIQSSASVLSISGGTTVTIPATNSTNFPTVSGSLAATGNVTLSSATSPIALPTSGTIQIDSEEITYTGISGSTLTGCTRGANGTTAATHTAGTVVTTGRWLYVYLYDNAGTPALEISATGLASPYFGNARSKSGDTSRRFIFLVRTSVANNLFKFLYNSTSGEFNYQERFDAKPFRILTKGTSGSWTTFSAAEVVPPISQLTVMRFTNYGLAPDTTSTGFISIPSDTATWRLILNANSDAVQSVATDTSQQVAYAMGLNGTGTPTGTYGGLYIDVKAFFFVR